MDNSVDKGNQSGYLINQNKHIKIELEEVLFTE